MGWKQIWTNVKCKLRCSTCIITNNENNIEIKIDTIDELKNINLEEYIPYLKKKGIKVQFI